MVVSCLEIGEGKGVLIGIEQVLLSWMPVHTIKAHHDLGRKRLWLPNNRDRRESRMGKRERSYSRGTRKGIEANTILLSPAATIQVNSVSTIVTHTI